MKKFLTILSLIVLVGIGGVVALPLLVDNDAFKQKFAENLQMITGRNVSVDGDFSLKFTPSPTITVGKTRVANIDGAAKSDMLEIEKITAKLDLQSFISGNIRISRAELVKPVIYLEALSDGQVNWMFDFLKATDILDLNGSQKPTDIALDSLTVQDGTVIFSSPASNVEYRLENLNGEMIAETLRGPYRFDGNFKLLDSSTGLAISLDKLNDREPSELNIMLTRPDTGAAIAFSGMLANTMQGFSLNGNMTAEISNPDKLITFWLPDVKVPETLVNPIAANLSLKMQGVKVTLADMVIKQGENSAVGNVSFTLYAPEAETANTKNLTGSFIISYLEVEPWLALLENICRSPEKHGFLFLDSALVEVKADRLKYKNGEVENLSLLLDGTDKVLKIDNIKAKLPVNADIQGNLTFTENEKPEECALSGEFTLNATKTGEIFKWLELPISEEMIQILPIDESLLKAEINASVASVYLNKIDFKSGNINISGKIGTNLSSQEKNIDVDLRASGVNIEKIITKSPVFKDIKNNKDKDFKALIISLFDSLAFVKDYNAKVRLDVSEAAYGQISSPRLIINGSFKDGTANITEFRLNNISGNSFSLRGDITGFNEKPIAFTNLESSLKLTKFNVFADEVGISMPFDTSKVTSLLLDSTLNGSLDKIHFKMVGDTSGAYFNAEGTYEENETKGTEANFVFEVRHAQIRNFIRLLSSSYTLPPGILGNFKLSGNFAVTENQTKITGLEVNIGGDKITGNAGIATKDGRKIFIAALETDTFYLDKYLSARNTTYPAAAYPSTAEWAKEPFIFTNDLKTITAQVNLAAKTMVVGALNLKDALLKIKIANRVAELTGLDGNVGADGKINVKGVLDLRGDIPSFTGETAATKVKISNLFTGAEKFNISSRSADFKAKLTGKGNSVYEMVASLGGSGTFEFSDGSLVGISLISAYDFLQATFANGDPKADTFQADFRQSLRNKETPFTSLTGSFNINNGEVTAAPLEMSYSKAEKAFIAFKVNLTTGNLNTTVRVPTEAKFNLPAYAVAVKGTLDAPVYTYADAELVASIVDRVKTKENQVKKEALEKAKMQKTEEQKRKQEFTDALEGLKKTVGDAYQKVLATEKMASLSVDMAALARENRVLGEKILKDFSPLVDFAAKKDFSDAEIKLVQDITEKVQAPIKKIGDNYDKILVTSAKVTAKQYAFDAAKFVKYARDMEKANPFAPIISDAAKKIDDAGYEAEIASRLAEESTNAKQAESAVLRAKKAFDTAKEEVARIVKFTGSTEGLE